MDSYIQKLFAERLGGEKFGKEEKIYKFEKIKRAKREALKNNPGMQIIDLGVGEPDDKAFPVIIDTLKTESEKHENRGYSDNGIIEFQQAAAKYMDKVFNVPGLNPETEIIHSIGSKPALSMLPSAFINPGDVAIMTVPGYPVLGTHTEWYGGKVYNIPLLSKNGFLPDLDSVPGDIREKAKLIVVNYPNNPTGAMATEAFFKELVQFARENNIIVIQDAAYAALSYNREPLSFLSIPGAKEVGIEIHSLSKSFNMTGWRMAFVAGNELVVKAYGNVKDNYDSGQFKAIQMAAVAALEHPEITHKINAKYERRLKALVQILNKLGFNATMPGGTFYLYVQAPRGTKNGIKFETAEDFSQFLIKEKLISSVPWDDAGHFVRFSSTFVAAGEAEEAKILAEIEHRLSDLQFEF